MRGGLPALSSPILGATPSALDVSYLGAPPGDGVVTGVPRVYLVFYGSQWGTQSTTVLDGRTYASFSGDPGAMAPTLQAFFAGLGTSSELWSGVMTQYCESTSTVTVAIGATTCPAGAADVGYPGGAALGGALQGVWEDTSIASPSSATQTDLATEAEVAAAHFGNTTTAASRNAIYYIVSPTGTYPAGFNTPTGNFCAWHTVAGGTYGTIAFVNMPYVLDMGGSCGANFVNPGSAGALDGVSLVGGHEYAETLTDWYPGLGWWNTIYGPYGEDADLCAWNVDGGASADLALATGSFPVQSTWSNDANAGSGGCALTRAPTWTNNISVASPGPQTSLAGSGIAPLGISASDSDGTQSLTYSAVGLPANLSINPSTGVITGTPTSAVLNTSVTVTATDATNSQGSATFNWAINNPGGNTITVANPGNQTSMQNLAITRLTIAASDNQTGQTLTYSATGLPPGLAIDPSTGATSGGTGSAPGIYHVVVRATDSTGASGAAAFTWTVRNTVTVTRLGNITTRFKKSVRLRIHATDTQPGARLTYSARGLPAGLKINASAGLITGRTNSKAKRYTVVVTVSDASHARGTTSFTWTVRR